MRIQKIYLLAFCLFFVSYFGQTQNEEHEIEVPFSVVEKPPIYPGCENLNKSETRNCFSKKIQEFVHKNFGNLTSSQRVRVSTIFKINKTGKVESIRARGSDDILEDKIIQILKKLPQMKPGLNRGKAVVVPYSLPVIIGVSNNLIKDNRAKRRTTPKSIIQQKDSLPKQKNKANDSLRALFKLDNK